MNKKTAFVKRPHSFKQEKDLLTPEQATRLHAFLKSNVAVGMELETCFAKSVSTSTLQNELKAQGTYDYLNDYGVDRVYEDGSLRGGRSQAEIVTVGCVAGYDEYHARTKKVEDALIAHASNINPSCSQHVSLVLTQSQRVPSIVLRNFYQLWRGFADSFLWLTSTTNDGHRRLRQGIEQYATPLSIMQHTCVGRSAKQICGMFQGKYHALNFGKMQTTPDGSIGSLFIEARHVERCQSAHVSTAWTVLLKAALLKATMLSQYGLLVFKSTDITTTENYVKKLAFGVEIAPADKADLVVRSRDLLAFLKTEIVTLAPFAYEVLQSLADKPVSEWMRQLAPLKASRFGDRKIEEHFETRYKLFKGMQSEYVLKVKDVIQLGTTIAPTVSAWCDAVAKEIKCSSRTVENCLASLRCAGRLEWDAELCAFSFSEG